MGLVYLPTWMVEIDGECSMDVPYMDPVGYEGRGLLTQAYYPGIC